MNKEAELAPIIIFAFNRPSNLKKLLLSLEKNIQIKNSKVIFFIDHYKTKNEIQKNKEVIEIASEWSLRYNVEINISKSNLGLKDNILNGINKTFEIYDKAIFLEDDLEVSKTFLEFMNYSLKKYQFNSKIYHVSGYNFPMNLKNKNSSYFTRYMNCWGWATWKDRWEKNNNFDKNLISSMNKYTRLKFTVFGFEKDFESQLIRNSKNEINTWAIYWYQYIFLNKGLCLVPSNSLVVNNGNKGVHGTDNKIYGKKLNNEDIFSFPNYAITNYKNTLKLIKFYFNKTKLKKLK